MKKIRVYYQIFFLIFFFLLIFLAAQGKLKGFLVTAFLDASPLNALGSLFSSWNVAHTLWIGFVILALTFFLGRFFCSFICPLGTIFHFVSWLAKNKKITAQIQKNKFSFLQIYKYCLLIILLSCALFGELQIGLFDPIDLLTRATAVFIYPVFETTFHTGKIYVFPVTPLIVGSFALLLLLNVYRPRFWCRYICPLGALLGIAAKFSPGGFVRNENKCTNCGLCTANCAGACEPEKIVIKSECLMCFNCVELCPENAIEWKWFAKPIVNRQKMSIANDKKRRLFISSLLAGIGAFLALRLSGSTAKRGNDKRIRPPGALNEEEFLARCLKCGECVKICPTNAIQPAISEAGVEGFLTPVLKMEIGYCELNCTLCGQVCPTGAIVRMKISEKLGGKDKLPVKIGTAFIDRNRCIPWTLGRECLVCQEVCPVSPKAIYEVEEEMIFRGKVIKVKRPYVDYEKCIGCGLCQHECPITDKAGIRVSSVGESRAGTNFII